MTKLKILAASDIHSDKSAAKRLAEMAEKYNVDFVVLAGDLTFFDESSKGMVGPFVEKGKKVIFVNGNHDSLATSQLITKKYNAQHLQFYPYNAGDVGFFGCGGSQMFGCPTVLTEDEIFDYISSSFYKVKDAKIKVMVTHAHAEGSLAERIAQFSGSEGVRKAIEKFKPDIHIHGHVHQTENMEEKIGRTASFTVGPKGKIIEIYNK
ncbi:MAG: metallophosphoesterase [Candidatus Aenigmarchaeota archaeon]|nr:metallophosphoesterase [Candidatus Aenigmarchaeota archaeon]